MAAVAPSTLASLRLLLEAYAGGQLPDWQEAAAGAVECRLRPGAVVFDVGDPHAYLYFVLRGLVKMASPDDRGQLRILSFVSENNFLASVSAIRPQSLHRILELRLEEGQPELEAALQGVSRSRAIAIEETVMVRLDFATMDALAQRHPRWANLATNTFYLHVLALQADAWQMRFLSAEERFRALRATKPWPLRRVTQRDLASYLGVTEVGLSRIVSRVRREDALEELAEADQ